MPGLVNPPMGNPAMVGLGAGMAGAGLLASAYGNVQGAEAMARARANQRAQQDAIQMAADKQMAARIASLSPAGGMAKAQTELNNPSIAALHVLNQAAPNEFAGAAGNYAANIQAGAQNDTEANITRSNTLAAPGLYGKQDAINQQQASNEQRAAQEHGQQAGLMYDRQLEQAGMQGQTGRLLGQLGTGLGEGIANYGIWAPGAVQPGTSATQVAGRINPQFSDNLFSNDLSNPMQMQAPYGDPYGSSYYNMFPPASVTPPIGGGGPRDVGLYPPRTPSGLRYTF